MAPEGAHVFTYGSLMYRRVWERVVTGRYPSAAATVRGYARRRIRDQVYPALVPAGLESAVTGILYRDVSPADLSALDRFEDEGKNYHRVAIPVELGDGAVLEAAAYLYRRLDLVEDAVWDQDAFEAEGLAHFLASYCRDRAV